MLDFICDGLRGVHLTGERREFLSRFWSRQGEFWAWQEANFGETFRRDALPVFLHGGSPDGRILVMGINPGYQGELDRLIESEVQSDRSRYVALHEDFYDVYPDYQRRAGGHSPYWNNLRSKLSSLLSDYPNAGDKWIEYRTTCVMQDIIPFRSTSQGTSADDMRGDHNLRSVAEATLEGMRATRARAAWLFSREGFAAVELFADGLPFLRVTRSFDLKGCTKNGTHRRVRGLVAELDRTNGREPLPILAIDNALISQPSFPFVESYCRRENCEPRLSMAAQIRALGLW